VLVSCGVKHQTTSTPRRSSPASLILTVTLPVTSSPCSPSAGKSADEWAVPFFFHRPVQTTVLNYNTNKLIQHHHRVFISHVPSALVLVCLLHRSPRVHPVTFKTAQSVHLLPSAVAGDVAPSHFLPTLLLQMGAWTSHLVAWRLPSLSFKLVRFSQACRLSLMASCSWEAATAPDYELSSFSTMCTLIPSP
jgi:hypothetical protein